MRLLTASGRFSRVYTRGQCFASIGSHCRVWESHNGELVKTLTFPSSPCSLELTADGSRMVLTYQQKVAFYDAHSWVYIAGHSMSYFLSSIPVLSWFRPVNHINLLLLCTLHSSNHSLRAPVYPSSHPSGSFSQVAVLSKETWHDGNHSGPNIQLMNWIM